MSSTKSNTAIVAGILVGVAVGAGVGSAITLTMTNEHQKEMVETAISNYDAKLNREFTGRVESSIEAIVTAREEARKAQVAERKANADQPGNIDGVPMSINDDGRFVYGNPDATISIQVFEDFRCGYCAKYKPDLEKVVQESSGEVNYVSMNFPILGTQSTQMAAAAVCIAREWGAESYFKYSKAAYQSKDLGYAVNMSGADAQDVNDCIAENRYADDVNASMAEGRALNITGTPASLFINQKTDKKYFVSGYVQYDSIWQMVVEAVGE